MVDRRTGAGEQLRTVPARLSRVRKIDLGLSDMESLPPPLCRKFARPRKRLIILGSYLALGKENRPNSLDFASKTPHGNTRHRHSETGTEKSLPTASQVGSRLRGRSDFEPFLQSNPWD